MESYAIRGGKEGYERLLLPSRDRWPDTEANDAAGRKLYGYFLAAGIPRPQVAVVQSVWTEGEEKTLAWSTLDVTAAAIVSERLAAEDEVTAALAALGRYTTDPRTLIGGPRTFQLWSRR